MITKIQTEKVFSALREGMNRTDACIIAGVGKKWFYEQLKTNEDFANKVDCAETVCKNYHVKIIQEAAKKNWTAAAWWLERKHPEEFALRQKHEVEGFGEFLKIIRERADKFTESQPQK